MDLSQLIELYNKVLLPFPQRNFNNSSLELFQRRKVTIKRRPEECDSNFKRLKTGKDVLNNQSR